MQCYFRNLQPWPWKLHYDWRNCLVVLSLSQSCVLSVLSRGHLLHFLCYSSLFNALLCLNCKLKEIHRYKILKWYTQWLYLHIIFYQTETEKSHIYIYNTPSPCSCHVTDQTNRQNNRGALKILILANRPHCPWKGEAWTWWTKQEICLQWKTLLCLSHRDSCALRWTTEKISSPFLQLCLKEIMCMFNCQGCLSFLWFISSTGVHKLGSLISVLNIISMSGDKSSQKDNELTYKR